MAQPPAEGPRMPTSPGDSDPGHVGLWAQSAWQAGLFAWAETALAQAGEARPQAWVLHRMKPWAVVFRSQGPDGAWWIKAAGPGTAFEAGLYGLLAEAAPDAVLKPLAWDAAKGWLLLPQGGQPMAEQALDPEATWGQALPRYAELQRRLRPQVPALLHLGLADMSPQAMPQRFQEALAQSQAFVARSGGPEEEALGARLQAFAPQVAEWAAELGSDPIGASLDHHDLHPGNLLPSGPPEALRLRFFDWGDAVVGHPFMSLLMALGHLKAKWGCAEEDPRLLRLRDAYLEAWGDLAPRPQLLRSQMLACRLALVSRSLVWQRALQGGGEEAERHAGAPLAALGHLLSGAHFVLI